jgi:hypothetical protein
MVVLKKLNLSFWSTKKRQIIPPISTQYKDFDGLLTNEFLNKKEILKRFQM